MFECRWHLYHEEIALPNLLLVHCSYHERNSMWNNETVNNGQFANILPILIVAEAG